MIFNRTAADVEEAKKIRENKVKTGQPLTEREIEVLERGMFTLSSINRIQDKQFELKNLINEIGYYSTPIIIKNFEETDFFTKEDFEQIINKVNPDIVHIFGTEYSHSLSMINVCEKLGILDKVVINNNAKLKNAYFVLATTPLDAMPRYNYSDINKIELLLNDLEIVLEDMKSKFKRCGTFSCGG